MIKDIYAKIDLGHGFHYKRIGKVCIISSDDGHKMLCSKKKAFWFIEGFYAGINAAINENNKIKQEEDKC